MNNMKHLMCFQRKILGILCALLVPSCILFGLFGDNLPHWYFSVSATYYANSKICMIGLLFATSVFFLSYGGYDWKDKACSLIQAFSALGVIVFPCQTAGCPDYVGLFSLPVHYSNLLHCASAAILFLTFGFNVFFLFTLGDESNTQKCKRNTVYHVCGILIFGFALLQALTSQLSFLPSWYPATLVNEFFMLEAYAVAWLTKSGFFKALND